MKIKLFSLIAISAFFLSLSLAQEQEMASSQSASNSVSLDIKGMDVVDVIKMLATRSGMNIVVGKNVTGKVTLFLKNVDVKDAFEIILLANELAYEKEGDIINVMTQRDYELIYGERYNDKKQAKIVQLKYAKAQDLSRALNLIKTNIGKIVVDEGSNTIVLIDTENKIKEMENFIKTTDLPIQTKVFSLSYGQADKIQPKLQEIITKGVGSLRIDERTNKIAVTDYPGKIDEITKIISAFDEKTPQVLIDAQIIEIRPSDKFEMGVDWEFWIKKNFRLSASLPISSTGRLLLGTTSTSPTKPGEYKAIVDLLRTIGDIKILSSPRIMTLNNQESRILVGTKEAYITSTVSQSGQTAVTSQTVNFVDIGIKLYVTPTINRDNFVTMKIKPEISSAQRVALKSEDKITEIPIVSTSEAETTVMVKDGVTIIIGGLKKDERTKSVVKVPILGDIPLLGWIFRRTSDEIKATELVILLTPHIMSGESPYTEFTEIKPAEGAVVKMVKGEIVTEKISASTPKQEEVKNPLVSKEQIIFDGVGKYKTFLTTETSQGRVLESLTQSVKDEVSCYYRVISNKINQCAILNSPKGKKGKVDLNFSVSFDGNLIETPRIISTTDTLLIPFAIKAVKDASPFPPFPATLEKKEESFKISLLYE